MKKKILAGLLSAMMVVALAACEAQRQVPQLQTPRMKQRQILRMEQQPLQQMHRAVMKGKK